MKLLLAVCTITACYKLFHIEPHDQLVCNGTDTFPSLVNIDEIYRFMTNDSVKFPLRETFYNDSFVAIIEKPKRLVFTVGVFSGPIRLHHNGSVQMICMPT